MDKPKDTKIPRTTKYQVFKTKIAQMQAKTKDRLNLPVKKKKEQHELAISKLGNQGQPLIMVENTNYQCQQGEQN